MALFRSSSKYVYLTMEIIIIFRNPCLCRVSNIWQLSTIIRFLNKHSWTVPLAILHRIQILNRYEPCGPCLKWFSIKCAKRFLGHCFVWKHLQFSVDWSIHETCRQKWDLLNTYRQNPGLMVIHALYFRASECKRVPLQTFSCHSEKMLSRSLALRTIFKLLCMFEAWWNPQ